VFQEQLRSLDFENQCPICASEVVQLVSLILIKIILKSLQPFLFLLFASYLNTLTERIGALLNLDIRYKLFLQEGGLLEKCGVYYNIFHGYDSTHQHGPLMVFQGQLRL
jgi:hypothetical protein